MFPPLTEGISSGSVRISYIKVERIYEQYILTGAIHKNGMNTEEARTIHTEEWERGVNCSATCRYKMSKLNYNYLSANTHPRHRPFDRITGDNESIPGIRCPELEQLTAGT